MAEPRRLPGVAGLLGLLLLIGPLAATAWWLTRPVPDGPPPGPPLDELDVVCTGRVDAEGLVVALDPNIPGKVVRVSISEGATVRKGAEILAVDDAAYLLLVREARAAAAGAKVELDLATQRFNQWPQQIAVKEKQLAAANEDLMAGEKKLKQLREQQSLTSSVSATDVEVAAATVAKYKLLMEAEQIALGEMRKADPRLELRGAEARSETAAVAVERAEQAVKDCVLRAPADGTIMRLQAAVGGTLTGASPLPGSSPPVVFAPAGPFVVRGELEQSTLGRVTVGMKAVARDDARPNSPTWTGKVKRVGGWVAQRRSILFEPGEMNDVRTAEVVIELDPSPERLWVGQRMQVRLVR